MGFLGNAAKVLLKGGLLGAGVGALFGSKRKDPPRQQQVTRDDARTEAERNKALAKRRGAAADRIPGASGEPVGGFGNFIVGS